MSYEIAYQTIQNDTSCDIEVLMRNYTTAIDSQDQEQRDINISLQVLSRAKEIIQQLSSENKKVDKIHINVFPSTFMNDTFFALLKDYVSSA